MKHSLKKPKHTHCVYIRNTAKGNGLFARTRIPAGYDFCLAGVYESTVDKAGPAMADYIMHTPKGGDSVWVPYDIKLPGWWLANHACFPNADTSAFNGGFIRAKRVIEEGEEISIWYGGWRLKKDNIVCLCGHADCLGWVRQPYDGSMSELDRWRNHLIRVLGMTPEQLERMGFK